MAVLSQRCWVLSLLILVLGVIQAGPLAADVRILTTEEPPTNYLAQQGVTGITTDVVREIQRRLNQTQDIELLPWARAYQVALSQPDVVIFTAGKTKEREAHGFYFIGPVVTRKHELWARSASEYQIQSIEDIKVNDLRLGAMRDDWRAAFFKAQGVRVQEVPNHEQNLKMLLRGRFDLWVTSDIEARFLVRKQGIAANRLKNVFVFKEAPSYILLSKGTSVETVTKWQQAFTSLQETGFLDRLARKWSESLGYELIYRPEKGLSKPDHHK